MLPFPGFTWKVVSATDVDAWEVGAVVTTAEVAEGALESLSSPPRTMTVRPAAAAMIATNPTSIAGLSERRAGFNHDSSACTCAVDAGSARVIGSAFVTGVTAVGATVVEAQKRAYAAVDAIDWPEGFCRRDIAWRAVNANKG